MKFLDIRTDFAFKKVFGSEESKGRLISFLNSIVYYNCAEKIINLVIVDPYNIPKLEGMKDTYVDVKAELDNGTKVIIEMQVLPHAGFEKRILYNMAKNYSSQLLKGEKYHLLNPVIALTIVDFTMFDDLEGYVNRFKLMEKKNFTDYSDDFELVFVELPKFVKVLNELENIEDEWIWFVKNAGSLEYIPTEVCSDVQGAFEIANEANMSIEELDLQQRKKDFIFIQENSITLALEKGIEQGLEKGIEQGLEQGIEQGQKRKAIEIAKNLLDVLDSATIAMKTGLTVADIDSLR